MQNYHPFYLKWYHWNKAQPVVGKVIIHNATCQKEGVTEGMPVSRLNVCVCVRSLDRATLALANTIIRNNIPCDIHTVHSEQKHSSSIRTFTRVSCPQLNRPATHSLWRHRKAKLHVSFSYRGKPPHRLPLFTLTCSRFTRPLFLLFARWKTELFT